MHISVKLQFHLIQESNSLLPISNPKNKTFLDQKSERSVDRARENIVRESALLPFVGVTGRGYRQTRATGLFY